MKILICIAVMTMTLFFAEACQDRHAKNYNNSDIDTTGALFIKNGIEGGLTEIKASGLAITNSNNQRIIGFAKMMIYDHTQAGNELKKIENDKKVDTIDTINAVHQQALNDLSKKRGVIFDKAYMQMMVADHTGAVKLFTDASHNADPEISKFASATLPTIQMHLDSANAILTSLR